MTAKRSDLVVPALVVLGLSAVVLVLSVIGKDHFGPLDGLCNGAAELEPHQSTGATQASKRPGVESTEHRRSW
jgi:hypothetical protein